MTIMEDGVKYSVEVNFYDLSQGIHSDGLWISGLLVFGKEFVFSKGGVESCRPGETILGSPDKTELIGETEIPYSVFLDFVLALADSSFRPETFSFSEHNSISFCEASVQFLCGSSIQKHLPSCLPDLSEVQSDLAQDLEQLFESGTFVDASAKGIITFGNLTPARPDLAEPLRTYESRASSHRAESPDFAQLQAQIDACRAESSKLRERRQRQARDFEDQGPDRIEVEPLKPRKSQPPSTRSRSKEPRTRQRKSKSVDRSKSHKSVERKSKGKVKSRASSVVSSQSGSTKPSSPQRESGQRSSSLDVLDRPKRVSFKDKPVEIIVEREEEDPVEVALIDQNGNPVTTESDEDDSLLPALEEVSAASSSHLGARKKVRSPPPAQSQPPYLHPLAHSESDVQNNNVVNHDNELQEEGELEACTTAATMAEAEADSMPAELEAPPKKNQKPAEPPVTFREFDQTSDFEDLVKEIVTMLDPEEQDRLREMEDWIIKNEGTWVLSEGFNVFLGRVLHDKSLPSAARVSMLRLLSFGAGMDDIVLIMHSDRKDHLMMNYAQEFDRHPIREQEALAQFFANLFENNSSSEWLLYISEWPGKGQDLSNIRVTTKVAVNALLGDTPALQDYGTAIMHNLGTKEVFDDICTELAMAILQFFQGNPKEEHVFRCMKALNKFSTIAHREVPQLIKMIGPEPSKFSGMSGRVDEFIQSLNARLALVPSF